MLITFIKRLGWGCLLVLLQALILNNVHFFGYATPFLYVYLLLKFNADISRYALLLWGFCIGLAVDIFSNTPGINAAATTLMVMARPTLLQLFAPSDSSNDFSPSFKTLGTGAFMRYAGTSILLHQTALILLLTFSFAQPAELLLKIITGSLMTLLCVWGIEASRK